MSDKKYALLSRPQPPRWWVHLSVWNLPLSSCSAAFVFPPRCARERAIGPEHGGCRLQSLPNEPTEHNWQQLIPWSPGEDGMEMMSLKQCERESQSTVYWSLMKKVHALEQMFVLLQKDFPGRFWVVVPCVLRDVTNDPVKLFFQSTLWPSGTTDLAEKCKQ